MYTLFRKLSVIILSGAAAVLPLAGQGAVSPPTTLRFYYLNQADANPGRAEPTLSGWLKDSSQSTPIEVDPGSSSPSFSYAGPGPVKLYSEEPTAGGREGKVIASLPLPAGAPGVLYLVSHGSGRFQFRPLPYSAALIPAGAAKVFNLCPEPLLVTLGKREVLIPAQGDVVLAVADTGLVLPVKVSRTVPGKPSSVLIETAVPAGKASQRLLYVLIPDSPAFNTALLLQLGDISVGQ